MGEAMKKSPSLPSNYVTLQQLQEKQLQKQREKEEERRLQEQRLREEEKLKQRQKKEEEERKSKEPKKYREMKLKGSDWQYKINCQMKKNWQAKEENLDSKPQKQEIEITEEIPNQVQKSEESKFKQNRKNRGKKKKKKNPLANEVPLPVNAQEEKILVNPAGNNEGKEGIRYGTRSKSSAVNGCVSELKTSMHQTAEIAKQFGDLKVDEVEKWVKNKSTAEMNGGGHPRVMSSGCFSYQPRPRRKNNGLIWVKKEEISDQIPS